MIKAHLTFFFIFYIKEKDTHHHMPSWEHLFRTESGYVDGDSLAHLSFFDYLTASLLQHFHYHHQWN